MHESMNESRDYSQMVEGGEGREMMERNEASSLNTIRDLSL